MHVTDSNRLRLTRSGNSSPLHYNSANIISMGSPYYRDMDDAISPVGGHHRSRSASRPAPSHIMDYPSMFALCMEIVFRFIKTLF